jgi:hypothetical protein
MPETSAQYVEPQELRMLRRSFAATIADMEAIERSLLTALYNLHAVKQRAQMNRAWLQAVDVNIQQELRT